MTNEALIIFVKNPVPGKVKTRLAKDVGDQNALSVYLELCRRLRQVTGSIDCDRYLYYSDTVDPADDWNGDIYIKREQRNGGLGQRMAAAFKETLNDNYEKVLLIGSDTYGLNADIITGAFEKLTDCDIVLGPAQDGGYYLIGMKMYTNAPFTLEEWSHANVLKQTIERIKTAGLEYQLLPVLKDIDTLKDLDGTDLNL